MALLAACLFYGFSSLAYGGVIQQVQELLKGREFDLFLLEKNIFLSADDKETFTDDLMKHLKPQLMVFERMSINAYDLMVILIFNHNKQFQVKVQIHYKDMASVKVQMSKDKTSFTFQSAPLDTEACVPHRSHPLPAVINSPVERKILVTTDERFPVDIKSSLQDLLLLQKQRLDQSQPLYQYPSYPSQYLYSYPCPSSSGCK